MTKLRDLILYFISKRTLGRTEIVKYIYMYEYLHRLHLGTLGTDAHFIRWHHGPYAPRIQTEVDEMVGTGVINSSMFINSYGNPSYTYTYRAPNSLIELDKDQQEIADYVLDTFSQMGFLSMINRVYSTPPMLKVLAIEDEKSISLQGDVLDMDYTNGVFKRTKESREAAKKRYTESFQPKGSDEEYFKTLTEELAASEALRRRANFVTDKSHS